MISALLLALLFAQQSTPPEKATLSGTVVDSITGQPLNKVQVVAEHHNSREPGASTTTDTKGAFELIDLDGGEYRLRVTRSGYLQTYYGAKRGSSDSGSPVILTAGQTVDNLHVKLTPFSVITGTVRDSDGEPLAGAGVVVFGTRWQNGRRFVSAWDDTLTADDLGQFRTPGLPPGRYYISASYAGRYGESSTVDHSAKTSPHSDPPVTTFYPGTVDPANAVAIELAPGARQSGVDVTLIHSRLHKAIVHVHAAPGLQTRARFIYATDGFGEVGHSRNIDKETIEITGVPSGAYLLRFGASVPEKKTPGVIDFTEPADGCGSSMPVSIGKDDTEEINANAPGCAQITGRVVTDTGKPLKAPDWGDAIVLDNADDGNFLPKADGSFRMTVSPGHHTLDFRNIANENNLYLKGLRAGNQDLLRNGLTLSGGDRLDLEVMLGSDGGKLEGVVSDADGKPVPGVSVVLIPNDAALRTRLDYTPSATTTQAGHYEMKAIAPGDYKLFAFDNIEKDSWMDPDVLRDFESKGTAVSVKPRDPNEKDSAAQTVNLPLIP